MGNVWEWGAEVGGHSWRTAGDLGYELNRIFRGGPEERRNIGKFRKPGSWNDPDYIQFGYIGERGKGQADALPASPNEQYAFMSLWCLMAVALDSSAAT